MPKRVLDFDALWASDKIAVLPGWAQAEYAWLYGLADASGSFELTNLRVIWGRVAAIRKDLTLERLEEVFQTFIAGGLLFAWQAGGKRYGHWTGSDVPGRLPPPSWRARLERLAPPVPKQELAAYMSRFSSRRELALTGETESQPSATMSQQSCDRECAGVDRSGVSASVRGDIIEAEPTQLNLGLEQAQAQEWDKDWKKEKEKGRQNTPGCVSASLPLELAANEPCDDEFAADAKTVSAGELLQVYERERGSLPAAAGLTPERRRHCGQRIRNGLCREDFAAAVSRAAATPFLSGEGARGWRASFDWLIANDTNVRKVLEGAYDAVEARALAHRGLSARPMDRALYSEIHVGTGPIAAECGARVRPEVLERIRAREAARGSP